MNNFQKYGGVFALAAVVLAGVASGGFMAASASVTPTTMPTTYATTAATTAPKYGASNDLAEVAALTAAGATNVWPFTDPSGTQFQANDVVGTDNIVFSQGNATGYANCYPIVDGSTGSTQFGSTFTGNASAGTTILPSTSSWSVTDTIIPSSLPTGSNLMELWNTGNPILNHAGVAAFIRPTGEVDVAWGTGTSYHDINTGINVTAQAVTAFTFGTPVVVSWNSATSTFGISVGDSTLKTSVDSSYTASTYKLSTVRNPQSNSTLQPFQGYMQYLSYAPNVYTQTQIDSINYAQNGPLP